MQGLEFRKVERKLINSKGALRNFVRKLKREQYYGADTEYETIDEHAQTARLCGFCFYLPKNNVSYYIPVNHTDPTPQLSLQTVRKYLKPIMESKRRKRSIWHMFKSDYKVIKQHGIDVFDHYADTYMGEYLLNENGHDYGLKNLVSKHFKYSQTDFHGLVAIWQIEKNKELRKLFGIKKDTPLWKAWDRIQRKLYEADLERKDVVPKLEARLRILKQKYKKSIADKIIKNKGLNKTLREAKSPQILKEWKRLTSNKFIEENKLSIAQVPLRLVVPYATDDPLCTWFLWKKQKPVLKKQKLLKEANVEAEYAKTLARMELRGIPFDIKAARKERNRTRQVVAELEAKIYKYIARKHDKVYANKKDFEKNGKVINLNSGHQLSQLLYRDEKLDCRKRTKKSNTYPNGQPSVDDEALQFHKHKKIIRYILEYREENKILTTYLEAFCKHARKGKDGVWRIHCQFNQYGAVTGRLSSSKPNLQNIPTGPRIRILFRSPKGWVYLAADYSQFELRILGWLANDKALRKAYRENKDIHAVTAMMLFKKEGLTYETLADENATHEIKEKRKKGKTNNFAVVYGMGAPALAKILGVSDKVAQEYIDSFFEGYSGVDELFKQNKKTVKKLGYVTTINGRRRRFPKAKSAPKSKPWILEGIVRQANNARIQGSVADIIKTAMNKWEAAVYDSPDVEMNLQVHDELGCMVRKSAAKRMKKLLVKIMEDPYGTGNPIAPVPLIAGAKYGPTWADAK